MKLSVLFTTYNSPRWLQKVLWSLLAQQHRAFEIIIADDGSTDDTRHLVDSMRAEFAAADIPVTHVWQEDAGFRKCRILNKAILHAAHDYLVFTDGDCVLRADFLAVHAAQTEPGFYLSGSYYKLPMITSEAISRADIATQRCFDRRWLRAQGLPADAGRLKLIRSQTLARWCNRLTPTACNLKGSNASAWKSDVLAVGGLDERMHWGGEDRELGVRLQNSGLRARHVRYNAICVHLDHARGYRQQALVEANRAHRLKVEREGISHTEFGTDRLLAQGYRTSAGTANSATGAQPAPDPATHRARPGP